jgi:hypothetical protein
LRFIGASPPFVIERSPEGFVLWRGSIEFGESFSGPDHYASLKKRRRSAP